MKKLLLLLLMMPVTAFAEGETGFLNMGCDHCMSLYIDLLSFVHSNGYETCYQDPYFYQQVSEFVQSYREAIQWDMGNARNNPNYALSYHRLFALNTNFDQIVDMICQGAPVDSVCMSPFEICTVDNGWYVQPMYDPSVDVTYLEINPCPKGGTSNGDSIGGVASCYIASGTSFSDTTGSWTYDRDCHYSE